MSPITAEQAATIDRTLAGMDAYLRRLSRWVNDTPGAPVHLRGWAQQAQWSVDGLRAHFASWARGEQPAGYPVNPRG